MFPLATIPIPSVFVAELPFPLCCEKPLAPQEACVYPRTWCSSTAPPLPFFPTMCCEMTLASLLRPAWLRLIHSLISRGLGLQVIQRIQQRLGPSVNVIVDEVASIPRTKAGKFKAVIG